jgi:hypothetical protein
MKTITCDKCGKAEAFYFLNMRDPFKEDTKEKARSLKRDLCRDCAKELATSLGLNPQEIPF